MQHLSPRRSEVREMMRGDNLYRCSHYSVAFCSPQAMEECQEGNLKGADGGGNKGRVLRQHAKERRHFEKSDS